MTTITFRDGTLSSFDLGTNTADSFSVAKSFVISSPVQNNNSLIVSNTFNKYFDASVKIQNSIFTKVGGKINSIGVNPIVSRMQVSLTILTNVTSTLVTVPAVFGSDPFNNKSFGIIKTLSFNHGVKSKNPVLSPTYQGATWSEGNYNILMRSPQFSTSVQPVPSTNQFILWVYNNQYLPNGVSLDGTLSDDFYREAYPIGLLSSSQYSIYTQDQNGQYGLPFTIDTPGKLRLNSNTIGLGARGVQFVASENNSTKWEIIFKGLAAGGGVPLSSSEIYNRCGIMWNFTGTYDNASFYCLSIGDAPQSAISGDGTQWARLLKVSGNNLSTGTSATITWNGGGTVTNLLGAYINLNGYNYIKITSDTGTITLSTSADGISYTPYAGFPVVDGSPLASGKAGFFSKAIDGAERYSNLNGPISFKDNNSFVWNCKVNLLFTKHNSNTLFALSNLS